MNKRAAASHHGKGGEHPEDRADKDRALLVDKRIVREEHEELLAEADVEYHKENCERSGIEP